MDVYISEEYVVKRRMERKSTQNGKINSSSGGRSSGNDKTSRPPPTAPQPYKFHRSEPMMGATSISGFGDAVFDCFSA
ncbi:nucleotide binding protein [Perilla frutescens var. hirtella]|nr:nucleotide binding protein [Perilla frutescens var. frutescens]KAH6787381.1 nucleotide binding protein [Perilla frutescens var. hirtella]